MRLALFLLCTALALVPWLGELARRLAPLAAGAGLGGPAARWASLGLLLCGAAALWLHHARQGREIARLAGALRRTEADLKKYSASAETTLDDLAETDQKLAVAISDLSRTRQLQDEAAESLRTAEQERDSALRTVADANLALDRHQLRDPVTGLNNRSYFACLIPEEAAQAVRIYSELPAEAPLPNRDLVFFLVEVDGFRQLHRRHGETAAQAVLQRTAQALRKATRESDAVLRWGEATFLVLARSSSRESAAQVAERIRQRIGGLCLDPGQGALRWTCSLGFTALPFQPADPTWIGWERTLEIIDACLAAARKAGEGSWVGVQPAPALRKEMHGIELSAKLPALATAGLVRVSSNRPNPLSERTGQVMG